MKLRAFAKILSFLAGLCLAAVGVAWLFIASSGAVKASPFAGYLVGAGFLSVAAPLLAFPFSIRVAKALVALVMVGLAVGMLWLAFRPDSPSSHPSLVQAAAIAFAVTLFARIGLALRRKRSALGT
ncbi:hypothetical protein ACFCQI_07585 [Rhodanobacter sp. FW102-FHT14D06]|uniref:Integron gene cassette protein n=2 Tax=unclassified Rhodanobacter TaxID=2621553 RepID=A0AB74V181_9GAMM